MVNSQTTSITPATHADRHRHGGADPLTGDVRVDANDRFSSMNARAVALNTVYENTQSYSILAVIKVHFTASAHFELYCDSSNPPTTLIEKVSHNVGHNLNFTFMVPAGSYYKFIRSAGTGGSFVCHEYY